MTSQFSAATADRVFDMDDRWRHFVDSTPLLMCLVDTELRGVYFNEQWLSFTGHANFDLLGDQWLSDIHPQDRNRCVESFRKALDEHKKISVECRLQRHDGEFRYFQSIGVPEVSDDGQHQAFVITAV